MSDSATSSAHPLTTGVFVGRQPIFDRRQNVYAYELLHRADRHAQACTHDDGNLATRQVIDSSLNVLSLDDLIGRRLAFVNIPRQLLLDQTYLVLPKDRVVIELLEHVEPDAQVIQAARRLKDEGYRLALDDFEFRSAYRPLLELADIVKVDFLAYDQRHRERVARQYGMGNAILLAEKVESYEDFQHAKDLGYHYFQGYFFCRPQVIHGQDLPAQKNNYLLFLQELGRFPLDYDRLEAVIKREMSLSVRLLRYLNSVAVGLQHRIVSIRHALILMGEAPLRKWASIVAMIAIADHKPMELITTCLVRGRFCEQLAPLLDMQEQQLDLFLTGLFSGLDAITDRPMEEVLSSMPLPADVAHALSGADSPLSRAFQLAMALERGNLAQAALFCEQMQLDPLAVGELYNHALHWADQNMHE